MVNYAKGKNVCFVAGSIFVCLASDEKCSHISRISKLSFGWIPRQNERCVQMLKDAACPQTSWQPNKWAKHVQNFENSDWRRRHFIRQRARRPPTPIRPGRLLESSDSSADETCLQHKHSAHLSLPLRVILITPKRAAAYTKKAKKERKASAKKRKISHATF